MFTEPFGSAAPDEIDGADGEDPVVRALQGFDVVCCMRERTAFDAARLARLPALKLLVTTGASNASIDVAAARAQGVTVCGTRSPGHWCSACSAGSSPRTSRCGPAAGRRRSGATATG